MNHALLFSTDRGATVRTKWDWPELYAEQETGSKAVASRRERNLLVEALTQLPSIAKSEGYAVEPSTTVLSIAIEFVKNLPTNRLLPRVAPDEEGNVLMVWGSQPTCCAITFEGSTLHVVHRPGSNSTHLEPTIYDGGRILPRILDCIPIA